VTANRSTRPGRTVGRDPLPEGDRVTDTSSKRYEILNKGPAYKTEICPQANDSTSQQEERRGQNLPVDIQFSRSPETPGINPTVSESRSHGKCHIPERQKPSVV